MDMLQEGLLLKGVGGLYTVQLGGGEVSCRARGRFRSDRITPVAGDFVKVELQEDGTGFLTEILPRKNFLVRPPVANLDYLVVVAAAVEPAPNTLLIDKMIAVAEENGVEPIVVINKSDLAAAEPLCDVYRRSGFQTFAVCAQQTETLLPLFAVLSGKVSAFTGNSGVGKSSILNGICPTLCLPTGEISQKLGRGKHTTRSAQLYPLEGGGYIVDTAGFSSVDMEQVAPIKKENLPFCFREFVPLLGHCRFTSCVHLKEVGCAVKAAVEDGRIPQSRYESYTLMFEEVKRLDEWPKK